MMKKKNISAMRANLSALFLAALLTSCSQLATQKTAIVTVSGRQVFEGAARNALTRDASEEALFLQIALFPSSFSNATIEENGRLPLESAISFDERTASYEALTSATFTFSEVPFDVELFFLCKVFNGEECVLQGESEKFLLTEESPVKNVEIKMQGDYTPPNNPVAPPTPQGEWPAAEIERYFGSGIPKYKGDYTEIKSDFNEILLTSGTVIVSGAKESDYNAYISELEKVGFSYDENNECYAKGADEKYQVRITITPPYPEYDMPMMFIFYRVKTSGDFSFYPKDKLQDFEAAGLPTYTGGKSFDLSDIFSEIGLEFPTKEEIEESIASAEKAIEALELLKEKYPDAYTDDDIEEAKADLELYKKMLSVIDLQRYYALTVYGTSDDELEGYKAALEDAGFERDDDGRFIKNYTEERQDYQATVETGDENDEKLVITLMRIPAELLEEVDPDIWGGVPDLPDAPDAPDAPEVPDVPDVPPDNPDKPVAPPPAAPEVTFFDLPENLRLEVEVESEGKVNELIWIRNGNEWLTDVPEAKEKYYIRENSDGKYTGYIYGGQWAKDTESEDLKDFSPMQILLFMLETPTEDFVQNGVEVVADQSCKVYEKFEDFLGSSFKTTLCINDAGFVLKKVFSIIDSDVVMRHEITLWDEENTSFEGALGEVALPN